MLTTILGLLGKTLPALGGAVAGAGRWLWTNRRWTLPVLLPALALVLLLAWAAWHYRTQALEAKQDLAADVQRQAREDEARRMGYPVTYLARRQADVEAAAAKLEAENAGLREQNAKADRELGKAKTLLAAALRGKPSAVTDPRPDQPGDEARPAVLREGDKLALGADLRLRQGEKAGEVVILGNLFADRQLDGKRLAVQAYDQKTTWATAPASGRPPAPEPRELRLGLVGGGQAGKGGVGWLVGGQVLYRDHWTLAGAGGPGPDRKGAAVMLLGVVF